MTRPSRWLSAGILLAAAAIAAPVYAVPVTDVVEAPSGFFVPNDTLTFSSPYWRESTEDWDWQHGAIGTAFTTASLSVSAFDVDFAFGEVDNIYAWDSGSWVLLGNLTGTDSAWEYGNAFTLGSNFFDDIATGLRVRIDIDANNGGWLVTLGKSALSLDGGGLPPPTPGVPEPSSWAMLIAGFGLVGAMARRRKLVPANA